MGKLASAMSGGVVGLGSSPSLLSEILMVLALLAVGCAVAMMVRAVDEPDESLPDELPEEALR